MTITPRPCYPGWRNRVLRHGGMVLGCITVLMVEAAAQLPMGLSRTITASADQTMLFSRIEREGVLTCDVRFPLDSGTVIRDEDGTVSIRPRIALGNGHTLVVDRGLQGIGWLGSSSSESFQLAGNRGTEIVAASDSVLVIALADGSAVRLRPGLPAQALVPKLKGSLKDLCLSKDGLMVACADSGKDGRFSIEVFDLDGNASLRSITTSVLASGLALSPDGAKLLAFLHDNPTGIPWDDHSVWKIWDLSTDPIQERTLQIAPPMNPANVPVPSFTFFPTEYGAGAGSFSPDGRHIIITNTFSGISIFSAEQDFYHLRDIVLDEWEKGQIHIHRWCGSQLLVMNLRTKGSEIVDRQRGTLDLWRVDIATASAVKQRLHPLIIESGLLAPDQWFKWIDLNGQNNIVVHLPYVIGQYKVVHLPDLVQVATAEVPLDQTGAFEGYYPFNDGSCFAINCHSGSKVLKLSTGATVYEDRQGRIFKWLGDRGRWGFFDCVSTPADGLLKGVLFDAKGALDTISSRAAMNEILHVGTGLVVQGPMIPPTGDSSWKFYTSDGLFQGTFNFDLPAKSSVLLVGRTPQGQSGILFMGDKGAGGRTVWWQFVDGRSIELRSGLNYEPQVRISTDRSRVGLMVSHREADSSIQRLGWQVWEFSADESGLSELHYDVSASYDAHTLTTHFPGDYRYWAASPDLRLAAIPAKDKLLIVDIVRNRLIRQTDLGIPLAIGNGFLATADREYKTHIWDWSP